MPLVALVAAATSAYAVYSIVRHQRYESKAFDMGIYDQVVWYWSHFRLPANTVQGFPHELGDHFSPIYALLAPAYWISSGPDAALVGQALLIGASIVAVERCARRRVEPWQALTLAASYALFWGVWSAIDFDFHETAFAAPLIAWAIDSADLQRWRRFALCAAALLLVKEDMGLVVAALGLWLVTQGARRQGLLAVAAGVCAFALVNGIVMPSLNGGAASATDHRLYGDLGSGPAQIAGHVVSHPADTLRLLTHPAEKLRLLLLTFGGFLFLTLLSPLAIVAVPQLLERLLTTDPHYWAPEFHYTLVLAPVLAIGAADGLARIGRIGRRSAIGPAAVAGLAICVLLFSVGSAATGPPARLTHASFYAHTGADRARDDAVKTIPAGAPVAAGAYLLPHLSDRARVYLPTRAGIARSDWLIYASTSPARIAGWKLVFGRDGIVVYKRALR